MASIKKRKSNLSVIYYYKPDENSEGTYKWETVDTEIEANRRKAFIEYYQDKFGNIGLVPLEHQFYVEQNKEKVKKELDFIGSSPDEVRSLFIPTKTGVKQSKETMLYKDYLSDFIVLYGTKKWGLRTYPKNVGTIKNYILPYLGEYRLSDLTTKLLDEFYDFLLTTKQAPKKVGTKEGVYKVVDELVTSNIVHQVHKIINTSLRQAVRWEQLDRNPAEYTTRKKERSKTTKIWSTDNLITAMNACQDPLLLVSIHLAFGCSMRISEIAGIQWDNVFISDEDIASGNAKLIVMQELARIDNWVLEEKDSEDILFIFPTVFSNTKSKLILKKTKTDSSNRIVWIPKTLALLLRKVKEHQEELKSILGCEYLDYNLLACLQNGRPAESKVIRNRFNDLTKELGLPQVIFHSLRHLSTTYKLRLTKDIKAVQGDTGHSEADMVTNVYSHIEDESRKNTAIQVDEDFYTCLDDSFYQNYKYKEDERLFSKETKKDIVSSHKTIDKLKFNKSDAFKPATNKIEDDDSFEVDEMLSKLSPEQLLELVKNAINANDISKKKKGISI